MNYKHKFKAIALSFLLAFTIIMVSISCETDDSIDTKEVTIERFEPIAALPKDTITIHGKGFSAEPILNVVEFVNAKELATVVSASESALEVVIPEDAFPGVVKVVTGVNSAISELPMLFLPSITSVNPAAALPGEQVIIAGQNFSFDINKTVVTINDEPVDFLFGGNDVQVIFPIPLETQSGEVSIKVGIILSDTETVFSAPTTFQVLDPEVPTVLGTNPQAASPGGLVQVVGNAFKTDPDSIFMTFDGKRIDTFENITTDELTFRVPEDFDIAGKGSVDVELSVSVLNKDNEELTSNVVIFTVVEPSDLVFYYTALNVPGFSNRDDDFVYRAEPILNAAPIVTSLVQENDVRGIAIDLSGDAMYYLNASIYKNNLQGNDERLLSSDPVSISDLAIDPGGNTIYFSSREDNGVFSLDIGSLSTSLVKSISGGYDENPVESIEFTDDKLYYTRGNEVRIHDLTNADDMMLFTHSADIYAVAVDDNFIYIVEGPTKPSATNVEGDSKIYRGNRNGSGTLSVLYERTSEIITDLEISDGILYWMVSDDSGGIFSAAADGSSSDPETVISDIQNGRYFKVVKIE